MVRYTVLEAYPRDQSFCSNKAKRPSDSSPIMNSNLTAGPWGEDPWTPANVAESRSSSPWNLESKALPLLPTMSMADHSSSQDRTLKIALKIGSSALSKLLPKLSIPTTTTTPKLPELISPTLFQALEKKLIARKFGSRWRDRTRGKRSAASIKKRMAIGRFVNTQSNSTEQRLRSPPTIRTLLQELDVAPTDPKDHTDAQNISSSSGTAGPDATADDNANSGSTPSQPEKYGICTKCGYCATPDPRHWYQSPDPQDDGRWCRNCHRYHWPNGVHRPFESQESHGFCSAENQSTSSSSGTAQLDTMADHPSDSRMTRSRPKKPGICTNCAVTESDHWFRPRDPHAGGKWCRNCWEYHWRHGVRRPPELHRGYSMMNASNSYLRQLFGTSSQGRFETGGSPIDGG